MSVKAMALVWDMDLPRDEKFVLLAYADHADHDGKNIFPSHETIADKTSYTRRQIISITQKLSAPREATKKHPARPAILIEDGTSQYGTNKWEMDIVACQNLLCEKTSHVADIEQDTPIYASEEISHTPSEDVKNLHGGCEIYDTESEKISHEPSFNHQLKPLNDGNGDTPPPNFGDVITAYENQSGTINSFIADSLGAMVDDWKDHQAKLSNAHPDKHRDPHEVVILAIGEMGRYANSPSVAYLEKVLAGWRERGVLAPKPENKTRRRSTSPEKQKVGPDGLTTDPDEYMADLAKRRQAAKERWTNP